MAERCGSGVLKFGSDAKLEDEGVEAVVHRTNFLSNTQTGHNQGITFSDSAKAGSSFLNFFSQSESFKSASLVRLLNRA